MTDRPPDQIDPREGRLAADVRSHAEQAVVPIDALAIAHAVATTRRRGILARLLAPASGIARLGWIGVGALLVVSAVAAIGLAGRPSQLVAPLPTSTPAAPSTAPAATHSALVTACDDGVLSARVVSWQGAAGSRIASVELTSSGVDTCTVPERMRLQLVDHNGSVLITGAPVSGSSNLTLAPGGSLSTLVEDSNYCGPTPVSPVTVAFLLADGTRVVAAPGGSNPDGVPPCLGPTEPGSIQMQAWHR